MKHVKDIMNREFVTHFFKCWKEYDKRQDKVDLFDELVKVCTVLANTHSMHGPCNYNSCTACCKAYSETKKLLAKAKKIE